MMKQLTKERFRCNRYYLITTKFLYLTETKVNISTPDQNC